MAEKAAISRGAGGDDDGRVRPEEDDVGKGAGDDASSSAASASAVDAVAEWRAESASSPARMTPYGSNSDFTEEESPVEPSVDATGDGRFGFCERLVKELKVNSPEGSTGAYGGVVDLSVSGMGGWIRVVRESRVGACEMTVRVWGPRGLEVFAREPMPTGL